MEIEDRHQLDNIYDTWIFLVRKNKTEKYKIAFIDKETNVESDKLFKQGYLLCPIYHNSMELEEGIYYE